jgi:hypothetical protein
MGDNTIEVLREIREYLGREASDVAADIQAGGERWRESQGKHSEWMGVLERVIDRLNNSTPVSIPADDIQLLTSCVSIIHYRKNAGYADDEVMDAAARVERWLKAGAGNGDDKRQNSYHPLKRVDGDWVVAYHEGYNYKVREMIEMAIEDCDKLGFRADTLRLSTEMYRKLVNEIRAAEGGRAILPQEDFVATVSRYQGLAVEIVIDCRATYMIVGINKNKGEDAHASND